MKHVLISIAVIFASLVVFVTDASAQCPLKPSGETVWQIDKHVADPAIPGDGTACFLDNSQSCALSMVRDKINNVFSGISVLCSSAQLANATLRVHLNGLGQTIFGGAGTTIDFKPPPQLNKLILDGSISVSPGKLTITTLDNPMSDTFAIKVSPVKHLEVKNFILDGGERVLFLENFTNAQIDISGLVIKNATNSGIEVYKPTNVVLNVTNTNIEDCGYRGISVYSPSTAGAGVKIKDSLFKDLNITKNVYSESPFSSAIEIVLFSSTPSSNITFENITTTNVNSGVQFAGAFDKITFNGNNKFQNTHSGIAFDTLVSGGTINDVTLNNINVDQFYGYALYFSGSVTNVNVNNPVLVAGNPEAWMVPIGIRIYNNTMNSASNFIINGGTQKTSISAGIGVDIEGNVKNVKIENLDIHNTFVAQNNIAAHTYLPSGVGYSNLPEPQNVSYKNCTFRSNNMMLDGAAENKPVAYYSSVAQAFVDDVVNPGNLLAGIPEAINHGIDFPQAGSVVVKRFINDPTLINVEIDHFYDKFNEVNLYLIKDDALYPISVDQFGPLAGCVLSNCTYSAETRIDQAHVSQYNNEDLDVLSIAVSLTERFAESPSHGITTMISPEEDLYSYIWNDEMVLIVDNESDDAAKSQCTSGPNDCSLRGAIQFAQDNPFDGPTRIKFLEGVAAISLGSILEIPVDNITIGQEEQNVELNIDTFSITASTEPDVIIVTGKGVEFKNITFDFSAFSQMTPVTVRHTSLAPDNKVIFNDTIFKNSFQAVAAQFAYVELNASTFDNVSHRFVNAGNSKVLFQDMTILNSMTTENLIVNGGLAGPLIVGPIAGTHNIATGLTEIEFFIAPYPLGSLTDIDVYLSFSNHENYKLESVGNYGIQPANSGAPWNKYQADGKIYMHATLPAEYTQESYQQWGDMRLHVIGRLLDGATQWTYSTNLSSPSDVITIEDSEQADDDSDGVPDATDNCPAVSNPGQEDNDGDGIGDACDPDDDNDGKDDVFDNCPLDSNIGQVDTDGDGIGDVCDPDIDNDGIPNDDDICPFIDNSLLVPGSTDCLIDGDHDSVPDISDNCVSVPNSDQMDIDSDNIGDVCDPDIDNDQVVNEDDNCPAVSNQQQADMDGDGIGDSCDNDIDGDGVINSDDNCVMVANPEQKNSDNDELGDVCDADDDNDGAPDDDNDGTPDNTDNCPSIFNENQYDTDKDGIGDACDPDIDGDEIPKEDDDDSFSSHPGTTGVPVIPSNRQGIRGGGCSLLR
jgi:hypothetical protein